MAVHINYPSMLVESLKELLLVSKYCIEFSKDVTLWGTTGCYGYPAALLLLSIVDSIGSHVIGGNVDKRFNILNTNPYFDLKLETNKIKILKEKYRDLLSHNSLIDYDVFLNKGCISDKVLLENGKTYILNLVPLYNACVNAVEALLNDKEILKRSQAIKNIDLKHNSSKKI